MRALKYSGRSDQTEMVTYHWFWTEISGILGWMESDPSLVNQIKPIYHGKNTNSSGFLFFFSTLSRLNIVLYNFFQSPIPKARLLRFFFVNLHFPLYLFLSLSLRPSFVVILVRRSLNTLCSGRKRKGYKMPWRHDEIWKHNKQSFWNLEQKRD